MTEHNGSMSGPDPVTGGFVDVDGERYYVIRDVDRMPPFFVSVISSADHWLFVSSSGGLTAGRVSPETALFPYLPVDRIHESNLAHRLQDDPAGRPAGPAGHLGAIQPGTRRSFRDQPQSLQERPRQQALLRGGQSRPGPRLPLHLGHERPAWLRAPVRIAEPRGRAAAGRAGRWPAEHPARGHAVARPDEFEQPRGRVQVDRTRRGHRAGRCTRFTPGYRIAPNRLNR